MMYLYAVPNITDDTWSSNAPPPPSGSASNNNNSVIAGTCTVGFLMALVVVTPLIIVRVLLYLVYTRRIVIPGRSRQGHNQTEKITGMVEEHSITETMSLYE